MLQRVKNIITSLFSLKHDVQRRRKSRLQHFQKAIFAATYSELLARTDPTIWDAIIAFFGGIVDIIGIIRKEKSNVISDVAIATTLMPPLCTAGYGLVILQMQYFFGALYLFFINGFFICLTTFVVTRIMRLPIVVKLRQKKTDKYLLPFWLQQYSWLFRALFLPAIGY